jgi:valyl-tRNA synthetase
VVSDFDPASAKETVNRWILTEAGQALKAVETAIESFRFDEAAGAAYRFVWNTYCDWYLELIKPTLGGADGPAKTETRQTAGWVLAEILRLLHPFMPFITEEVWAKLSGPAGAGRLLAVSPWPDSDFEDREAAAEINWLIRLVEEIRSVRAETNIPAGAQIPIVVSEASAETAGRLERHRPAIARLARVSDIQVVAAAPSGSAQIVIGEAVVSIPLAGLIDLDAERARLAKEIDRLTKEIAKIDDKLGKPDFVAKAPEEVVEEQRERREDALLRVDRMRAALGRLPSA